MENTSLNLNSIKNDRFSFVLSSIPSIDVVNSINENELERNIESKESYDNFLLGIMSVDLPSMDIPSTKVGTSFSPISVPTMEVEFGQLSTNIKMDSSFFIYKLLHTWMIMIKNPEGYNNKGIYDTSVDLFVDASLVINDTMENKPILSFDMTDLRPSSLPPLNFDYRSDEQIEMTVTWDFTTFELKNNRGILVKDENKRGIL